MAGFYDQGLRATKTFIVEPLLFIKGGVKFLKYSQNREVQNFPITRERLVK